MFTIEVVASTLHSALNAQRGGAARIELCSALGTGGITPSAGLIKEVRKNVQIPLYVMVRPREGDFVYSPSEIDVMKQDISMAKTLGANGIVLGVLTPEANIDFEATRQFVEFCKPLPVTFHRAFDLTADLLVSVDKLVEAGCERVLTSGGKKNGLEGASVIHDLARYSAGKISVMPGGGLTDETITHVFHPLITDYHLSGRVPVQSAISSGLFEMDYSETDAGVIQSVREKALKFFGD